MAKNIKYYSYASFSLRKLFAVERESEVESTENQVFLPSVASPLSSAFPPSEKTPSSRKVKAIGSGGGIFLLPSKTPPIYHPSHNI